MIITLFDIETFPNVGYVWGKWKQNVIAFKQPWYMLSFAYKTYGEKKVHAYSLPDFKGYKKDKKNDKELCQKLWDLLDKSDIVIAHNGRAFDVRKTQAKFLEHGFPPPTPFQQIDTLSVVRKYFKFDSNKLDDLGKMLKVGKKLPHEGFKLWTDCGEDDIPSAWKKMVAYNKQDVQLLEDIYVKMRPWVADHPNLNLLNNTQDKCPKCSGIMHKRGFAVTRVAKHQRLQCQSCGGWSQRPLTKGIVR